MIVNIILICCNIDIIFWEVVNNFFLNEDVFKIVIGFIIKLYLIFNIIYGIIIFIFVEWILIICN